MARKPKYDYTDVEFLLELEGLARDGWDDKQIAEKYHIEQTYFCDLKQKYPQLNQALKRGRKPLNIIVENSLYKRAVGLKTKTIIKQWIEDEEGSQTGGLRITETETEYPPDTGAAMAWLKQRKPELWNKQPIKIDHTSNGSTIQQTIIVASEQSKDILNKLDAAD